MSTLLKPKFGPLSYSECGGAPVLKTLWEKFDFTLLLTQSGINKHSGTPSWIIAFAYIIALISGCSSVSAMSEFVSKDSLLTAMFRNFKLAQYTFSRFLTQNYNWQLFGLKRVARLQDECDTALMEGDVVVLDDTKNVHSFARKMPFLCWLFDSSDKVNVWCMNIVATYAVLGNGLQYPLLYKIWVKTDNVDEKKSKIKLSQEMLLSIRQCCTKRLWVAMDRWFLCKYLFNFLTDNNFDWVTKAKRNTALFRKEYEKISGRERFVPIKPIMLIMEVCSKLLKSAAEGEIAALSIPDIYMKIPYQSTTKRGKQVTRHKYVPIAAIVATRLQKDNADKSTDVSSTTEDIAIYRGVYLIISNRHDVPLEALQAYVKRWSIEVFFRTAKQELGFSKCHSTNQNSHYAHLELIFVAETLLCYAKWELNANTSESEEVFTHGQMVKSFFNARLKVKHVLHGRCAAIEVCFDTAKQVFAKLIEKYWPQNVGLYLGTRPDIHLLTPTA